MNHKFNNEVGIILSEEWDPLVFIEGNPGSVDFPSEFILDAHKRRNGFVHVLMHTHPPGMTGLSFRDELTLKTLAFTLYPFPIRMGTLTLTGKETFIETTYLALLEPKELWEKGKIRKFSIEKEHVYDFVEPIGFWRKKAIEMSYKKFDKISEL